MNDTNHDGKTAKLVPLSDLVALAKLGKAMRDAQKEFFAKRRAAPHAPADTELANARDTERRFDKAVAAALKQEQQALKGEQLFLPGMGEDGV